VLIVLLRRKGGESSPSNTAAKIFDPRMFCVFRGWGHWPVTSSTRDDEPLLCVIRQVSNLYAFVWFPQKPQTQLSPVCVARTFSLREYFVLLSIFSDHRSVPCAQRLLATFSRTADAGSVGGGGRDVGRGFRRVSGSLKDLNNRGASLSSAQRSFNLSARFRCW